ncbi:hypothetical protein [Pseudomonas chlororaphis]|uniref:hypothetical protein n=1 Tax=Pseudomonas chlororaphis TaxID=587753 RepID=UPI0012D74481|nr:hypothetical protein [Pseudomonas chlororaphis]
MAYSPDMRAAARRHLEAANTLDTTRRRDVAGYLYGIAAECGVKALMQQAGFKSPTNGEHDPYYAHFPALKTLLKNKLEGRNATVLRRYVLSESFFSGWDITMRYSKGSQIPDRLLDQWKAQATSVIGSIDT